MSKLKTNETEPLKIKAVKIEPLIETAIEKASDEALTVLRTETALSRFPLHRIAKKSGDIAIEIHNQAAAVHWSVSHNTKYGQPGPLAYRIDTLLVNRRIEEAGKPVPRLIRLGSLPEIAKEMGFTGHNWSIIRRALHQNASAYITAKINYRTADRTERFLEAGFNRYAVIFTGEKLPTGETADAVYLVLSDIFLDVLNSALWRPLDYDYMKSLPAGSQRFYEIVSYQVYAALHHGNPRAKMAYSEYCLLSTLTRYPDFDHVKKQMHKIIRPHIESGYLAKVQYEAFVNEQGEPDWFIYLTPGINANREFRAFTGQGKTRKPKHKTAPQETPSLPFSDGVPEQKGEAQTPTSSSTEPTNTLIEQLVAAELNRSDAERLAATNPDECRRQLDYLPYVKEFKTSRGAYLRRAIEEGYGPPKAYSQAKTREESAQTSRRRKGEEALRAAEEKARQSHQKRYNEAFTVFLAEWVGEWEKTQPEAFKAFTHYEAEKKAALINGPLARRELGRKAIEGFDLPEVRADRIEDFCRDEGQKFGLKPPTFWEWDETLNPEPFRF